MSFKSRSLWVLGLLIVVGLVFVVWPVEAAGLVPCQGIDAKGKSDCTLDHLLMLLVNIYNFLLGLAAMVALFFIIVSGFRRLTIGFVDDSSEHLEAAKKGLTRAITGLIVIACAYLIVNSVVGFLTGQYHDLTSFFSGVLGIEGVF